jgi:hypothetical protein
MDLVHGNLRPRSYRRLGIHEEDSERIRAFGKTTFPECFRSPASNLDIVIPGDVAKRYQRRRVMEPGQRHCDPELLC